MHPRLMGSRGAVTAEHYLSVNAGADTLKAGGNAVDAAVAAVLVEGLLNPQMNSIGGECPMLVYMADRGEVVALNGNMAAPAAATPEAFRNRGFAQSPSEGVMAAGIPATPSALITALKRFGTMSFADVAASAIELARNGAPQHCGVIGQEKFGLRDLADKFRDSWPSSAELYLENGSVPAEGAIFKNPALASMLELLAQTERATAGDRVQKLDAVHAEFYRGAVADEIAAFSAQHEGLLVRKDLEAFETYLEAPLSRAFGDATLFKCGFWTQGPASLQVLALMEQYDPASLGHNSADYLHLLIEATKLAYADREQFYGDARFAEVPAENLLSDDYARARASLICMDTADGSLRPGDAFACGPLLPEKDRFSQKPWGHGTVHVDVIDKHGNMVAATPSGGWIASSPVIPSLGFPLGNRMMTFYLEPPHHPNVVAPGKRPRTTISPSLAFRNGEPWMVFGSMGGDQQEQWQLQFFLNRVLFGMTVQEAIEAPKISSEHYPGFFAPHNSFPNFVRIEPRIGEAAIAELRRRGHEVEVAVDWSEGYVLAAARDANTGLLEAGFDPRGAKSEVFPAYAQCW